MHFNSRPCERGFRFTKYNIKREDSFQFTPLREGLRMKQVSDAVVKQFQFTPLREGLPRHPPHIRYSGNFNSRPCERGFTALSFDILSNTPISIHAPARGASIQNSFCKIVFPISIHAPARGASQFPVIPLHVQTFQFTPLREGLHTPKAREKYTDDISIHAPARGASA